MFRIVMAHLNERNSEGNDRVFVQVEETGTNFFQVRHDIEKSHGTVTRMYLCETTLPVDELPDSVISDLVLCRVYPMCGDGWKINDLIYDWGKSCIRIGRKS